MSTYSITNVIADMSAALHGTTLNSIANINGLFNRAAGEVLADCDPIETIRFATPVQVFQNVNEYTCPTDLKGTGIIDVFKQSGEYPVPTTSQTYNYEFARSKKRTRGTLANIKWNTYFRTLELAANPNTPVVLDTCDALDINGTWVAGGGASNLTLNNLNHVQGGGSLQFDLSGVGYLEKTFTLPFDLSTVNPLGSLFEWFSLPIGSSMTSVAVRWGTDASNYWESTQTQTQSGTDFQSGWNLLQNPWPSTKTGTPDVTKIYYIRVTFTPVGTILGCGLDYVQASLGSLYEIVYYSDCLFRDAITGAFTPTVTANSNLLNLNTDSYPIFFNKAMILSLQQQQGLTASFVDIPFFENAYTEALNRYTAKNPGQTLLPQTSYYGTINASYANYIGQRWF